MTDVVKTCPQHHSVALLEVNRGGVMIDVCPECKGIWLDRGELERIVQLTRELEAEVAGPPARATVPDSRGPDSRGPDPRGPDARGSDPRWDSRPPQDDRYERRRDWDDDDDHRGRDWDDGRKRRKGPLGKLLDIFD